MTTNGLGNLMMTAVIDPSFRERLLTAPAEIVSDFNLTDDERQVLTSIRAGSFTEFAAQLHQWLEERDPIRTRNGWRRGRAKPADTTTDQGATHPTPDRATRSPGQPPLLNEGPRVQRRAEEEARIPLPIRVHSR